jgi:hypothetical protein
LINRIPRSFTGPLAKAKVGLAVVALAGSLATAGDFITTYGVEDLFSAANGQELVFVSSSFNSWAAASPLFDGVVRTLDSSALNQTVLATFTDNAFFDRLANASITFRARPLNASGGETADYFGVGFRRSNGDYRLYTASLGLTSGSRPILDSRPWTFGQVPNQGREFTVDLTRFPLVGGGTIDLVEQIRTAGVIDIFVTDDSQVDFFRLAYDTCCDSDLNCDRTSDSADLNLFITAFTSGDTLADLNDDGQIYAGDFQRFLNAFLAGC